MTKDHFASPKRSVARARDRTEQLQAAATAFFQENPHRTLVERNATGTHDHYKLSFGRPMPDALTDFVVEAVHYARVALDQAGYASAVAGGKVAPKATHFPIADTAVQLGTDVLGRGRCKDIPADIITLFRSFKPYQGGNDPIWTLNRLANSDKHRLVTPVVLNTEYVTNQRVAIRGNVIFQPGPWDSEKHELLWGVAPAGADFKYDFDLTFFIAFGEIQPLTGQPIVPTLRTITSEVERIVLATEAECCRLGLIPPSG